MSQIDFEQRRWELLAKELFEGLSSDEEKELFNLNQNLSETTLKPKFKHSLLDLEFTNELL